MPRFQFQQGELTAEHRRCFIHDIDLDVNLAEQPPAEGVGPELLRGGVQVEGAFTIPCPISDNRLRPGQLVVVKLTSPDGRFTKVQFLLTELKEIRPKNAQERDYRWAFLVPGRPLSDAVGLFHHPGAPAALHADPTAREVTLAELLERLGSTMDQPAVRFTAEGGFIPTPAPESKP